MSFLAFQDRVLILASGSDTRRRMLQAANIDFVVQAPSVDEQAIKQAAVAEDIAPTDIAVTLAELKAQSIALRNGHGYFVLGSDQLLVCDGKILSKPHNHEEAHKQLSFLAGKSHQLITAAVLFRDGQRVWHHVETPTLDMRSLNDSFITDYLDAIGPAALWSPGSYQVEAEGIHLFSRISGDHYAVLGLPLIPVLAFLREHGFGPKPAGPTNGGSS